MPKGIYHTDPGEILARSEYIAEDHHELAHGTIFPANPVERQLFYRDDLKKWFIYNGTTWLDLTTQTPASLDDIGDVSVPSPANKHLLYYDAATFSWKCQALSNWGLSELGSKPIEDLDWVEFTALFDKDIIYYDKAYHTWRNVAHIRLSKEVHGCGSETINDLYDIIMNRRFLVVWYANISTYVTGSGAVTQLGFRADLATGATINSLARCTCSYSGFPVINTKEPKYEVDFMISSIADVQAQFGLSYASDPLAVTGNFGIDILNNAFRAFSSDGTTRSVLDLATPVVVKYYTIKQRLVGGALKTWIDGVAKADKTTNLPTTQNISAWTIRITNTAAAAKTLYILTPKIVWKP